MFDTKSLKKLIFGDDNNTYKNIISINQNHENGDLKSYNTQSKFSIDFEHFMTDVDKIIRLIKESEQLGKGELNKIVIDIINLLAKDKVPTPDVYHNTYVILDDLVLLRLKNKVLFDVLEREIKDINQNNKISEFHILSNGAQRGESSGCDEDEIKVVPLEDMSLIYQEKITNLCYYIKVDSKDDIKEKDNSKLAMGAACVALITLGSYYVYRNKN